MPPKHGNDIFRIKERIEDELIAGIDLTKIHEDSRSFPTRLFDRLKETAPAQAWALGKLAGYTDRQLLLLYSSGI